MTKYNFQQTYFIKSASELSQLPKDDAIEIAFVGRSNAGKSSALNALAKQKKLAKTSKTPGRTQLINLFGVDDQHRLVDLPGYGYAQVTHAMKLRWQRTLAQYLHERENLQGLVLLADIRHALMPMDCQLLTWAKENELPTRVVLTKSDKLSKNQMLAALQKINKQLTAEFANASCQLFSIQKPQGIDELAAWVAERFSAQ